MTEPTHNSFHGARKVFRFNAYAAFDEIDSLGVLHHSRYLTHLERASLAWFAELLGMDGFDPLRYPDLYQLVHRVEIDYLLPIRGPQPFLIDLSVGRVRAGGLIIRFTFLSADGAQCFCRGERTVVHMGMETHQPSPWSDPFYETLRQWHQSVS